MSRVTGTPHAHVHMRARVCMCEREREGQTERQTKRQTQRQTDRQTNKSEGLDKEANVTYHVAILQSGSQVSRIPSFGTSVKRVAFRNGRHASSQDRYKPGDGGL